MRQHSLDVLPPNPKPTIHRQQIIMEFSALGHATYLTQHHQLYIDNYFYVNCTNTLPPPPPNNTLLEWRA